MRRLVIIGNGFDLHHKMKTSYLNYRDFLLQSGKKDIVQCFEDDNEADEIYLWNNLEQVLGLFNYERAYCYLIPYGSNDWRDSAHHDFQYEIEKMTKYWPGIKENLAGWIRQIKYTQPDDKLNSIINEDAFFLSFNYTNTLEVLYGIDKKRILYIHGDASCSDELVLGHRNDSYYPEWDVNNVDLDVRLLEADVIMENHRKNTLKDVERIISENVAFFNSADVFDEIYVIGLSYNEIDAEYLKQISMKNKSAVWYLNWYSVDDFNTIDKYIVDIGVKKYNKINIDV